MLVIRGAYIRGGLQWGGLYSGFYGILLTCNVRLPQLLSGRLLGVMNRTFVQRTCLVGCVAQTLMELKLQYVADEIPEILRVMCYVKECTGVKELGAISR